MIEPRDRPWPATDLALRGSVVGYFQFVHTTVVNKVAGLDESQARETPLRTSPAMSVLGLVKHLTAVQRQHIQIHVGGQDLPLLWSHEDTTADFRIGPDETVDSVLAAYDEEWVLSQDTLAAADWSAFVTVYGRQVRVERLLVDVLQESARHLGQLDIVT